MQKTIIAALLAAVLAGAFGFFGGVTYQKAQAPSFPGPFGQGGGFGRQGGPGGPGGPGDNLSANVVTGTVIAQDDQSITVKSVGGGSKTVFISGQTQIEKQQMLKVSDIKVGEEIGAFGQAANGGIDARMLQVIPPGGSFRMGGMGGRAFGRGEAGTRGAASGPGEARGWR